jgi:DnaK suppressor protein
VLAKTAAPTKAAPKAVKAPAKAVSKAAAPAGVKATPVKAAKQTKPAKEAARTPTRSTATAAPVPARPEKPKKPAGPPISPKTLERLRILLEEERSRLLHQADELQAEADALVNEREQGDTQFDEESGEGDTLSVERERDLALSEKARQSVFDIDRALNRMDTGTYGVCDMCGDRIPVARLEALPYAELCVKCKSRGERRR